VLISLGMIPIDQTCPYPLKACYKVVLDGRVLGFIQDIDAKRIAGQLRLMKLKNEAVRLISYFNASTPNIENSVTSFN